MALAPVSGQHPLKTDTDGDGIPDGWEDEHGLNPIDAGDANLDYNSNGLTKLKTAMDEMGDVSAEELLELGKTALHEMGEGGEERMR